MTLDTKATIRGFLPHPGPGEAPCEAFWLSMSCVTHKDLRIEPFLDSDTSQRIGQASYLIEPTSRNPGHLKALVRTHPRAESGISFILMRVNTRVHFSVQSSVSRSGSSTGKSLGAKMMSSRCIIIATVFLGLSGSGLVLAHDGHHDEGHDVGQMRSERTWTDSAGHHQVEGSFLAMKGTSVQIRKHSGELFEIKLEELSHEDRLWVQNRVDAIVGINTKPRITFVSQKVDVPPEGNTRQVPEILASFQPFDGKVKLRWDKDFFFVESNGIPDHQMMVGITNWQQQVPLPQSYFGDNAWRIPLHPVPAKNPMSAKNHFLRGAIALAPNGVPIFNPLNNRGEDSYKIGELDEFGGHCGRADDYHYHIAPVHLEKTVGKGLPIAVALDGYPIYGYDEPDGSKLKRLDALNGHADDQMRYHYHASKTYPYLNGGFHGEVTERGGQVDPQPRAEPIRQAMSPLRGARITDFRSLQDGGSSLTYEVRGQKNMVNYKLAQNGSADFKYIDGSGKTTTETYQRRGSGPGNRPEGGGGDPRPPRPGDEPPKQDDDRAPGQQETRGRALKFSLMTALDQNKDGDLSVDEIAAASRSLLLLDRDKDGRLSEEELRPVASNNEPPASKGVDQPQRPLSARDAEPSLPLNDFGPLVVSSPAFKVGEKYPVEFTCDGAGVSPPLEWKEAPIGTKSFALSVWHVPPGGGIKSYWVVYNIPRNVAGLPRNAKGIGVDGLNDKRRTGYDPMCSQGPGLKTYHITLYALSQELTLARNQATRAELLKAMDKVKLGQKTLTYQYER